MTSYAKKTDTVSFLAPIPQQSQLDAVVLDAVYVYYNLDATRGFSAHMHFALVCGAFHFVCFGSEASQQASVPRNEFRRRDNR
jgi:hypothetical protein